MTKQLPPETFEAAQPGLLGFLEDAGSWSGFAKDLAARVKAGRALTPAQLSGAVKMRAKVEAKAAAKAAAADAPAIAVDLKLVHAVFATILGAGNKRATFRAEGLMLSAVTHGPNAGGVYVKDAASSEYLGKVVGGVWKPTAQASAATLAALGIIAIAPLEAAVRYGRKTGACACCGRTLVDPESIRLGIGPICKQKWGL